MAIDPDLIFIPINIALLTVSDTRTAADDTSGDILAERIERAGHGLVRRAIARDLSRSASAVTLKPAATYARK